MKSLFIFILVFAALASLVAAAPPPHAAVDHGGGGDGGAEAHLWLNITGCFYVGEDPDPWLSESCVTVEENFDLTVTNRDPNEDSYNTTLLIALKNDTGPITVKIDGNLITGYVNDSPAYGGFGPHGVYPAPFAKYDIGFIASMGNKSVQVDINASGPDDMVHFDAVGFDVNGNYILRNPFSHDVTYMPEFTLAGLLLVAAVGGMYAIRKKRS